MPTDTPRLPGVARRVRTISPGYASLEGRLQLLQVGVDSSLLWVWVIPCRPDMPSNASQMFFWRGTPMAGNARPGGRRCQRSLNASKEV